MTISERFARFDGVEEARAAILDIYMSDGYFADEKCVELYEKINTRLEEIRHTILAETDKELDEMSKQA